MTHAASSGPVSEDQRLALAAFAAFLASRDDHVFVLSGAAGTGKTTLLGQMIEMSKSEHRRAHLAALTGRAATIARLRTGNEASTLHSFLYRFDLRASKVVDDVPQLKFSLRDPAENPVSVLFVDEASMLGVASPGEATSMRFGSGNLAADLLAYLFAGRGGSAGGLKLVLVGDPYQLPPVGDNESIAFGVEGWDALAREATGSQLSTRREALTTVHRQGKGGVLDLATCYRNAMQLGDFRTMPMPAADDPEVRAHATSGESVLLWARRVAEDPVSQAIIAYTNKGVAAWNRMVRQERWGDPDLPIRVGDLIANTRRDPRTTLDNGEILEVQAAALIVRVIAHLGREVHLREVTVRSTAGGEAHDALLADNALASPDRTMAREDFQVLWVDFTQRHRGLRESTPEFWDAVRRDPILNPIVAKYGYALTGHKAQSGQWDRVLVDFNGLAMAPDSENGFRWTYTAITRARKRLDLIDPPYRSPFSRLGSRDPSPHAGEGASGAVPEESPDARRARVERAVDAWATSAGHQLSLIDRKTYNTRFEVASDGQAVLFDVYFSGEGLVTKRLAVRSTAEGTDDLMPPLPLLERASFEGMPRPSDPRIDAELAKIEEALRTGGLVAFFRRALEWIVELEVGTDYDAGVLLLSYRKTGVFSGKSWKRPPGVDVQAAVDHVLEALSRD